MGLQEWGEFTPLGNQGVVRVYSANENTKLKPYSPGPLLLNYTVVEAGQNYKEVNIQNCKKSEYTASQEKASETNLLYSSNVIKGDEWFEKI